jgi:threonine/homoserine/homoserine lactone efflux protein
MPDISTLLLFSGAAILLIITPGPDMLYVIARSLGQGRTAGIISALGVCAGVFVHILAAAIGLSALLMSSNLAYTIVKYAGAAYLVYLGIHTLLRRSPQLGVVIQTKASLPAIFFQGVLSNALNPKVALFFLAFFPQFINPTLGKATWQVLILGLIFVLLAVLIMVLLAIFSSAVGHWLHRQTGFAKIQKWVMGSIFIGLGVRLALIEE